MRRWLITLLTGILLWTTAGRAETLLMTSDLHLTADAAEAPRLDALTAALDECDAILLLGDLTNNAHAAEHEAVRAFLTALSDTGAEVYAIPGNHDLSGALGPRDYAALYAPWGCGRAFSRDSATASCAVMTRRGTCLMLLDTNALRSSGSAAPGGGIGEDTLKWVAATLESLPPDTPVIACGHHPILPPEDRAQTPGAGALADALRRGGVRLYLCGHDHGFAAVQLNGLQQITVGQPQAYPGWAGRLTVEADALKWEVAPLYESDDPVLLDMARSTATLSENMARACLKDTPYEDDDTAIQWFTVCFYHAVHDDWTPELCTSLLNAPGADIWRAIEPRNVVKRWIFGLLERCPQSVQSIVIPLEK